VHELELPAATVAGVQVTEESEDSPVTASENVTEEPPRLAVKTAEPVEFPVAVKFALDVPEGTVTDGGTDADGLPLASVTVTPPEGAAAARNSVQPLVAPGAIVPGEQLRLASVTC